MKLRLTSDSRIVEFEVDDRKFREDPVSAVESAALMLRDSMYPLQRFMEIAESLIKAGETPEQVRKLGSEFERALEELEHGR